MKHKLLGILMLVTMFLFAACRSEEASDGAGYPGPTPTPTLEKLTAPEIKSDDGLGSVYGKINWNEQPAAGLYVKICQDFNTFSGCQGQEYTAQTEDNGTYTFRNVEPGIYALSIRVFASDEWIYASDGIFSAADYTVAANKTLTIDPRSIYKLDIEPLKPAMAAEVKSGERIFQWAPYEDAAYYEIYLTPDEGDSVYVNQRVDGTSIKAQLLPQNCQYRWTLAAFNAHGVKIAETSDYWEFSVVGQTASCYLSIEAPQDGVLIEAQDVVLEWISHPNAAYYKILLWDDDDPDKTHVLDFYRVEESEFYFNGSLTPGHRYVWSVTAYNADGDKIAASETQGFSVQP